MIKGKVNHGQTSIAIKGYMNEVHYDAFALLTALYAGLERQEPGEGEKLLEEFAAEIQEGKVQKWAKEGKI